MLRFEWRITVKAEDLDNLQHVNNVRYLEWIQEISRRHWESAAPTEWKESYVWVVRNHNITYKQAAVLGDQLELSTYIVANRGALSTRVVELKKKNCNQILCQAETQWCLLDAKSHRPKAIPDAFIQLFCPPN